MTLCPRSARRVQLLCLGLSWILVLVLLYTSFEVQLRFSLSLLHKEQLSFLLSSPNQPQADDDDEKDNGTNRKHPPTKATANGTKNLIVDILSVGSQTQPDLQDAQQASFGSHIQVRHFYRATEADDTEQDCHTHLTKQQVAQVAGFCRRVLPKRLPSSDSKDSMSKDFSVLRKLAPFFFTAGTILQKGNPQGWLCAQKRPFDGFRNMRKLYYSSQPQGDDNSSSNFSSIASQLPDYLLVLDDDTWVNLPLVLDHAHQEYPPHRNPQAVAGCLIRTSESKGLKFSVPYGGYGLLLNRKALERLLLPLYCPFDDNVNTWHLTQDQVFFARKACWRLKQNNIGEAALFRNGDSLADVMHAYATHKAYREVESAWQPTDPGFCLHSDWNWAYFINYYGLASASPSLDNARNIDRLLAYNHSEVRPWENSGKTSTETQGSQKQNAEQQDEQVPDPQIKQGQSRPVTGECKHGNDLGQKGPNGNRYCNTEAHFCHRITPSHMRYLHNSTRGVSSSSFTG